MAVRNEVQALIFDKKDGENIVLLVKKRETKTEQHRWRLLKGGIEEGETKIEALVREIFEETGLKNIRILEEINNYEFFFKGVEHKVSCFLVKADSKEPINFQKSEIAGYTWVKKEEALRMLYWSDEKKAFEKLGQIHNSSI
jgi:8-oxo-dGTP pyrophosphatase MutT (NUDIX family)